MPKHKSLSTHCSLFKFFKTNVHCILSQHLHHEEILQISHKIQHSGPQHLCPSSACISFKRLIKKFVPERSDAYFAETASPPKWDGLQRIQHHCQFPPRASQRLNLKEFDTAFFTLISWNLWNGTALSSCYEVYSLECRLQRRWSLHSDIVS